MARLPNIRQPERQSAMAPASPTSTRSMADLPPSVGYLQGEIERLPVAGPITGDEEFPILQGGQAKRGSTRSLIKRIREEANDVAENAAKLAVEGGGSGRHSLVRSFNRARSLSSLDGSETVGIVREGEFFRVPMSLLLGSSSGGDADTLGGQLPAYFLDWGNFTGVPTTFTPSPHTHPISDVTGLQTALDAKAALASPALTGNPTAPTQAAGNNSTRIATTAYTDAAIAALIASAPGVLDTLDEIAAALGDDPNFAATMTTALAGKLAKSSNLSDLTNVATARTNLGVAIGTDVAAQSHVGSGGSAHAAVVAGGAAGFMTGTDKTKLDGIASGATATNASTVASAINGTTPKGSLVDADELPIMNSAASFGLARATWATFKSVLKAYFDALYAPLPAAWATMVVTVSSFSGTIGSTSVAARRTTSGKTVSFSIQFTIVSIGSAAQYLILTMPFSIPSGINFALSAQRSNDGALLQARMDANTNRILLNGNGGTFPFASGDVIFISGTVETT